MEVKPNTSKGVTPNKQKTERRPEIFVSAV